MARETHHIRHDKRLALLGRGPTHASSEADLLARGPSLEGTEKQGGLRGSGICGFATTSQSGELVLADVEAGPVNS